MAILKRNNFVATLIYVLFYFSPILANPFAYLIKVNYQFKQKIQL